jgi:hypothetical protein
MLLAKEYLGEVGVGATSPLFFRADDGYIYVVKTMTNPLGGKVLANEYIASLFGRMLGLPFPRSDYFYITQEWFDQHPYLTDAGIGVGIHFASRYLEDVKYVTNDSLSLIRNRNEIAGMILFDHLFHNADRAHNRKNMILSPTDTNTYTLYGIDHSHLFRSGRWTAYSLHDWEYRIRIYDQNWYGVFFSDWIYANDFLPYMSAINEINTDIIKDILRAIPREWIPDATERKALFRFIKTRFDLVYDIYRKICAHIPIAHGGYYSPYLSD